MSKRTRLAKAPYTSSGSLMDWVGTVEPHEWRDNKPFPAMLILQGSRRGMSSAQFVWRSDKGHVYNMFMTDMVGLVQSANNLYRGTADTWWIVQKRGKNYGIRLADNDDLKHAGHVAGPKTDCPACEGVAYGYESWCPLPPTADQPHQARADRVNFSVGRCLCGEKFDHAIHGSCTCAPEDRTACSADNCPG